MNQWSRHDCIMIAWDAMLGPTFHGDSSRPFHHFVVSRGLKGDGSDAVVIGRTEAEAYVDRAVQPSVVYYYRARGADENESTLTDVGPMFSVATKPAPPYDLIPPTTPADLSADVEGDTLKWAWTPSVKSDPTRLLAYLVYDSNQEQPKAVVWAFDPVGAYVTSWDEPWTSASDNYRLVAVDKDLNFSAPSAVGSPLGFTVYTFSSSSQFLLKAGKHLLADVLRQGGGGTGGGGFQGGGGGGGRFIDDHDFLITAGANDGDVIVGAGGAEVPAFATEGNPGGNSSFGGVTAQGGGYGSSEWKATDEYPDGIYYQASDGGSGGGSGPWESPNVPGNGPHHGTPGEAVYGDYGHKGGSGEGYLAWYNITGGGGGGSWWPAYGGNYHFNGGIGRPCDIAGWGPLWKTLGIRMIPWFGGGGAGKERRTWWGYLDGHAGYGGGGEVGDPGLDGTGGGGGGSGVYEVGGGGMTGIMPGPKGGDGVVIIRIRTRNEKFVEYPVSIGTDGEGNPVYPEGIQVTHIGAEETHTDTHGEETVVYWGWPDPADHDGSLPP